MALASVRWTPGDVTRATLAAIALATLLSILLGIAIAADGSDNFLTERSFVGVPAGLWVIAVQQLIFLGAAWRFSISKYRVGVRSLGFAPAAGRHPYAKAFAGWMAALAAIVLWGLFINAIGIDSLNPNDNVEDIIGIGGSLALSVIIVGFWGPLAEEVFFRGFVLNGLRRRFGANGALAMSAALWAIFHIDPTVYVPIFFFGIVLGWLYMSTGSIWPPIAVHMVHNTVILLVATLGN